VTNANVTIYICVRLFYLQSPAQKRPWSEPSSVHWRHVINVTSAVSGDTSRDSL